MLLSNPRAVGLITLLLVLLVFGAGDALATLDLGGVDTNGSSMVSGP